MKTVMILVTTIGITALSTSQAYAQECANPRNSVLGNIKCNQGIATCHQGPRTGEYGSVGCAGTADCLSPSSIAKSVGAVRRQQWGVNARCASPLVGEARGGSTTTNNQSTATAVFAWVQLQGQYVAGHYGFSQLTSDFFAGLVDDDDLIKGLC